MTQRALSRSLLALLPWIAAPARAAAQPVEAGAVREIDDYDRLGKLERDEVDAVLAERGLTVDRAPAGKTIRAVIVVTRPVFSRDDGFLTFFNFFHFTTRPRALENQLLLRPGDRWDRLRADEALRDLRDPLYHNVIVILPVATGEPGTVDALVVARDVWSLRLNSNFQVVGSTLTELTLSISENNVFGFRKRAAFVFDMDQGEFALGPRYDDPNLLATRVTVSALLRLIFARATGEVEGSRAEAVIAYPFRSFSQPWGAAFQLGHLVNVQRSFVGTSLRTYDDPDTPAVEAVPWVYRWRQLSTEAEIRRGFGSDVVQRVGLGHDLDLFRPTLPADFPDDPVLAAAFTRDVLPRSELSSSIFARWQLFTAVYAELRDLGTFDFREDYQLGPNLEVKVGEALTVLGSDRDFTRYTLTGRFSADWGGGLYRIGAGASGRLEAGDLVDQSYNASLFIASPRLGRAFRLVASAGVDWLVDDRSNRFLVLGGANGLRGYAINQLIGQARWLGHLEVRTLPLHVFGFYRLGAVAFWYAGDAAPSLSQLSAWHGVGIGLRSLIPQLDALVIRIDWAFALGGPTAGWPGRLTLGFDQVF